MRKITKRSAAIITASVVAVGGAGAAWAWTVASGSGTTTVSSATNTAVTITGTTVTDQLYPGASSAVAITVTNPNAFPVKVDRVSISGVADHPSGDCNGSNFTVNGSPFTVAAVTVNGNGGTAVVNVPSAVTMNTNAADGCANKTFTVNVSGVNAYVGDPNH